MRAFAEHILMALFFTAMIAGAPALIAKAHMNTDHIDGRY